MGSDVKKIIGETPTNAFEAVDMAIKAQQELIAALHIMQSIIDNPDDMECHNRHITNFLNKYSDESNAAG